MGRKEIGPKGSATHREHFDQRFGSGMAEEFIRLCAQESFARVSDIWNRRFGECLSRGSYHYRFQKLTGARKEPEGRRPDLTAVVVREAITRTSSIDTASHMVLCVPSTLKRRAKIYKIRLRDGRLKRIKAARARRAQIRELGERGLTVPQIAPRVRLSRSHVYTLNKKWELGVAGERMRKTSSLSVR